jgi:hypothetical protein
LQVVSAHRRGGAGGVISSNPRSAAKRVVTRWHCMTNFTLSPLTV